MVGCGFELCDPDRKRADWATAMPETNDAERL